MVISPQTLVLCLIEANCQLRREIHRLHTTKDELEQQNKGLQFALVVLVYLTSKLLFKIVQAF